MKSLKVWVKSVLGKSIDLNGMYGCQSPDIVNSWSRNLESCDFDGDAYNLTPTKRDWYKITNMDVAPGDIVTVDKNNEMPFGNCGVVTDINSAGVLTIVCNVNGVASYWKWRLSGVDTTYRNTKLYKFWDIKK